MKIPLRIKETLYHDSETGKPVGSEYWVFDDAAEELFVINDDEDAARRIVAAVNACEGITTETLEFAAAENIKLDFVGRAARITEIETSVPKVNARLLEALKTLSNIAEPIFRKYDEGYEQHEMPAGYTSPDSLFIAINAARAAIAEAEQHEPAEPAGQALKTSGGSAENHVQPPAQRLFKASQKLAECLRRQYHWSRTEPITPLLIEVEDALRDPNGWEPRGIITMASPQMENPATAETTSEQILEFMGQAAPFVPREKIWMLPPTLTPSEMKKPGIVEVRPTQQIVQAYGGGMLQIWENMRAPQPTPEIPKVVVPKQDAIPYAQPTTMKKILFLDTETVGIPADPTQPYTNHHNWPEMVSIAWQLQSESGEYITAGDYIVAPRPGVENGAAHINGITPEMQETYGTEIHVVLKKLLEAFADADLVVAHHVQFDQSVIFAELDRLGYEIPRKEWYCTKAQSADLCQIPNPSKRYAGKWKWPSLDELHQFLFNEPIKGRDEFHGAAVDMWACARRYHEMQRRAAGPKDYTIPPTL